MGARGRLKEPGANNHNWHLMTGAVASGTDELQYANRSVCTLAGTVLE